MDVQGRRKCNFCRYQKCLLIGMSTKSKSEIAQVTQGSKQKENCSSPPEVEMEIEPQNMNKNENNQTTTIATLTSDFALPSAGSFEITFAAPPLSSLSSEIERVKQIKKLYHIQCELDPIKANEFIPLLEATRKGQSYDKRLVVFSEKVCRVER